MLRRASGAMHRVSLPFLHAVALAGDPSCLLQPPRDGFVPNKHVDEWAASVPWTVEHGCASQDAHWTPQRQDGTGSRRWPVSPIGRAPVSGLYGNSDMRCSTCLLPRHEPRRRYPVPWAT